MRDPLALGPGRRFEHQGGAELSAGLVTDLGRIIHERIQAERQKVHVRDAGDRPQARGGRAHRHADDGGFRHGGVADPARAESLEEAGGLLVRSAELRHVLPQHEHALVPLHLFVEGARDRFAEEDLGHGRGCRW